MTSTSAMLKKAPVSKTQIVDKMISGGLRAANM
jgi:hypothetical protein